MPASSSAEGLDGALRVLGDRLLDRDWRLRNLYYITDKSAARVLFEPNWAQAVLFDSLAHRNIDLKVRQLGVTTGYCILWLDAALFNRNLRVGIVAHTKDDARIIFRDKIKFAYDNLPPEIRAAVPAAKCDAHELLLDNGSGIRVGVTFRSGTVQVLHVTEYGYICQRQPQRAEEIRTGAFQAVPASGIIVVESTAKGRAGHFHELCQDGRKGGGWRFTFLPWWKHPGYCAEPDKPLEFQHEKAYLDKLELALGQALTPGQRQWWCVKHRELGDDMYAEYPSTPEEAFKASTEGAYYGAAMLQAWQDQRVTRCPVDRALLVDSKVQLQQLIAQQAIAQLQSDTAQQQAVLADKANARGRDVEVIKTGRQNVRADLMLLFAFGAVVCICWLLANGAVTEASAAGGFMMTVGGMFARNIGTAFDFEFGSSRSSLEKTEALKQIAAGGPGAG